MRRSAVVPLVFSLIISASEVVSFKKFPESTRPPVPPPPPPRVVFTRSEEPAIRLQTYEMIAPNNFLNPTPTLSLGNSDFNIQGATGYRPRPQPQRPQRPQQPPRPQQPTRPQPPRPQRPQIPFSRPFARPPGQRPPGSYQEDPFYYQYSPDQTSLYPEFYWSQQ